VKGFAIALLLSSCAIAQTAPPVAACGPQDVSFKVVKDKSQHPTPTPENGKAILYVFGWGTLAVDGTPVGAVSGSGDYFVLPIDPGEHHLCARFSARVWPAAIPLVKVKEVSLHSLEAKPGETYYVALQVTLPYYGFKLDLLDPDQGKYVVAASTFSTSHPR
jgi:hypothetical protein